MNEVIWDGFDEQVDEDHQRLDQPGIMATLRRTFPTYTEIMEARGYPGAKMIVLTFPPVVLAADSTMPGVIRELPLGWRDMASAETFRARFDRTLDGYRAEGWK
jgi:hypothetical protein